jgi:hypothetical protein
MADDKPPKITKQDLTRLEQLREERYQLRAARHNADQNLDPRLRKRYLNRTIVDTDWIAKYLGYSDTSKGRISVMRNGQARIVPTSLAAAMGMTTAVLPGLDVSLGVAYGRHRPGTEQGRVEEWAIKTHRMLWNRKTDETVPNQDIRQGRPRHARPTLGPDWHPDPGVRRQLRMQRKKKTD